MSTGQMAIILSTNSSSSAHAAPSCEQLYARCLRERGEEADPSAAVERMQREWSAEMQRLADKRAARALSDAERTKANEQRMAKDLAERKARDAARLAPLEHKFSGMRVLRRD